MFLRSTWLVYLVLLFSGSIFGSGSGKDFWKSNSYPPNLNFLPYYEFSMVQNNSLLVANCASATNVASKNPKSDEITLFWDDVTGVSWEYMVQVAGGAVPTGKGIATSTNEVIVKKDFLGANLIANTDYEFFVRTNCGVDGFGGWEGPYDFTTLCMSFSLPFTESFDSSSDSSECWTILDVGNDQATSWNGLMNIWINGTNAYKGNGNKYFDGGSGKSHNDWLISPALTMSGKIYAITYYYKTDTYYNNEFEVLLSTKGMDPVDFTTVLQASSVQKKGAYTKTVLYVTGITGDVYIAWHVLAKGYTEIMIDEVSVAEIDCIAPKENVIVDNVKTNEATVTWEDDNNDKWEYYVQEAGGTSPVSSGSLANSKSQVIKKTNGVGSSNLKPNTDYEIYIRANCGPGKYSMWVGPIKFRTPCDVLNADFWEGFNKNSQTINCWNILDLNNDKNSYGDNAWKPYNYGYYEGDQSMYFYSNVSNNDDWLISPTIKTIATEIYRLRYRYKTSSYNNSEFEVMLSSKGNGVSDLTTTLIPKKVYKNEAYLEAKAFVSNVTSATIGWHVTTKSSTNIYIDDVFFEKVVGCPEPLNLDVNNIKDKSATLNWTDDFKATGWEYWVQAEGEAEPVGNGISSTKKSVDVIKDGKGSNLTPNTEYEFYVRTNCGDGTFSVWSGPFVFRTACAVLDLPYWEGFNSNSETIYCWDQLDENKDGSGTSNKWVNQSYGQYEGSHTKYFYVYDYDNEVETDDWLITPTLKLDSKKMYRFRYYYKTNDYNDYNNFEVLASNSGRKTTDFKKVIVANKNYKVSNYLEHRSFISNFGGDVQFAWHTFGTGSKNIYIDNVFVEEVLNCPEPLELGAKDEEKNKATILWTDDFKATKWEYYVQEQGVGEPLATVAGTSTSKKENIVDKEFSGEALKPNTDYEFYVRTNCGDGTFSIWTGPYVFTTTCDVYTTPFLEGFNSDTKTIRCWSILDGNDDGFMWTLYNWGSFEGDGSMNFNNYYDDGNSDLLVSPTLIMSNSTYVLKYHYISSDWYDPAEVEVVYSSEGVFADKFTTVIHPKEVFSNTNWKEKVVFFNAAAGQGNIGWNILSETGLDFSIDKVIVKQVTTCKEPYYVEVVGQTSTSIDIKWQQDGGNTEWEIIVVKIGDDETGTPVKTMTVKGSPQASITGLPAGAGYTIYVRAKCSDGSFSDWSTGISSGTKPGGNEVCSGAINMPVNVGKDCEKIVSGSLIGAVDEKLVDSPSCNVGLKRDIWFEFTAISDSHLLRILDWVTLSGDSYPPDILGTIYDQPCGSITATALECFYFSNSDYGSNKGKVFKGLIPGQKYYVRLGLSDSDEVDYVFNLCMSSPNYLEVSPQGEKYTTEELVKDVLVNSNCDLVSNVRYQVGDGSAPTNSVNALAYFNKNDSDFPFEEGIVLSTSQVKFVPGPYTESNKGTNPNRWKGDKDINDAIKDAGGGPLEDKRVTQLEFDFIPIKDSIKFDYLFASNSYIDGCTYTCMNGALFAAWLIDTTTGEGVNLAKIKGTNTPISLYTIWDNEKITGTSCNSYPELFWNNYTGHTDPFEAPLNFAGSTVGMSSETVYVVPGRQYHIKLAVMDFCTNDAHSSAVFFAAGSFDLGSLDLGADMLVEDGSALCGGECVTIKSGLGSDGVDIKWYKDGVVIDGEAKAELEVCESGTYKAVAFYPAIKCEVSGEVVVEIFPAISQVVLQPKDLSVCANFLGTIDVDLASQEEAMFKNVNKEDYEATYYLDVNEAKQGSDNFIDPLYNYKSGTGEMTAYIRIVDLRTNCAEIFEINIRVVRGEFPSKPEDVVVCAKYVFPNLLENQFYYTEPGGKGNKFVAGDILTTVGDNTIYVLQMNGDEGCYEEISYKVSITGEVKADVFESKVYRCLLYPLKPLSEFNSYHSEPGGKGVKYEVGTVIYKPQKIYVYASSPDGLCVDESSFTVDYEDCPIAKGISPNGDGLNDSFDLSLHGVQSLKIYNRFGVEVFSFGSNYTNQWVGQDKSGNPLPDGTYYYVVTAFDKTRTGWVQINK
ncbi:Cleaved Adhesin Domain [Myroides guanonis]|uniref:Cleaved Adhesin Domain n=2 Tax=Myroides guanonis TaxID=1150112 RepID=A0A1I3V446_9FLAO|nr:Cleaved Adhesin Domain [Myroides guanonis]